MNDKDFVLWQLDGQTRIIKQILCHSFLYFIRHYIFIIGICFVSCRLHAVENCEPVSLVFIQKLQFLI